MKHHRSQLPIFLALALGTFSASASASASASGGEEKEAAPPLTAVPGDGSSSDFAEDLRVQGFFFGGGTSMSNAGEALLELGGGADYVFRNGVGIGGEGSVLGNGSGSLGTFGVNLSYHFLPDAPGIEPFVSGGMSFGSGAEYGLEGYTWASAGGGFNYWFGNGMALRVEVKGRYDVDQDDHTVGIRVGLTF